MVRWVIGKGEAIGFEGFAGGLTGFFVHSAREKGY
jgi:hypothetical protein